VGEEVVGRGKEGRREGGKEGRRGKRAMLSG